MIPIKFWRKLSSIRDVSFCKFWIAPIWLIDKSRIWSFFSLDKRKGWMVLRRLSARVSSRKLGQSIDPSIVWILFMERSII